MDILPRNLLPNSQQNVVPFNVVQEESQISAPPTPPSVY